MTRPTPTSASSRSLFSSGDPPHAPAFASFTKSVPAALGEQSNAQTWSRRNASRLIPTLLEARSEAVPLGFGDTAVEVTRRFYDE